MCQGGGGEESETKFGNHRCELQQYLLDDLQLLLTTWYWVETTIKGRSKYVKFPHD